MVQSMTNTDTADVASTVEQVAALARAGQLEEAGNALSRVLELDPRCTVQAMRKRVGYSEKSGARIFDGWRKAGMPES